jgi:PadR family transcriptional regulator, regulatory protein PadR
MRDTDVRRGSPALMVMSTLETSGPQPGYGIARPIEPISQDQLIAQYGTLTPVLLKRVQEGSIAIHRGVSEPNRRARFPKLTRAGRRQIEKRFQPWGKAAAVRARWVFPMGESV